MQLKMNFDICQHLVRIQLKTNLSVLFTLKFVFKVTIFVCPIFTSLPSVYTSMSSFLLCFRKTKIPTRQYKSFMPHKQLERRLITEQKRYRFIKMPQDGLQFFRNTIVLLP